MGSSDDYYVILGVPSEATPQDVTAAYHLLVRQHHPDASDAQDSLSEIKRINEAYEVLSDPQKRSDYDRRHPQRPSSSQTLGRRHAAPQPPEVIVELPIAPEEAQLGGPCEFTLSISRPCPRCRGNKLLFATCSSCHDSGSVLHRQRHSIMLPPGLRTGSMLRLARDAQQGPHPTGDLLVRVAVRPCW